jgi:hypothetical protein
MDNAVRTRQRMLAHVSQSRLLSYRRSRGQLQGHRPGNHYDGD